MVSATTDTAEQGINVALLRGRNIWVKIAALRNRCRRLLARSAIHVFGRATVSPQEKKKLRVFFSRYARKKFESFFSNSPEAMFFSKAYLLQSELEKKYCRLLYSDSVMCYIM